MKPFKLTLLAYILAAIAVYTAVQAQESNRIGIRRAGSYEKAHHSVTGSFQELVGEFSEATVRVLVDDKQVALGTVVGQDGLILTKASALAEKFECKLRNGKRFTGQVIGKDEQFDLALVQIDAQNLQPVKFSDSAPPKPASWVISLDGYGKVLAVGITSTEPRKFRLGQFNRGNENRGFLGVMVQTFDQGGLEIIQIVPQSAAEGAGLKVGDVIETAGDKQVNDPQDLVQLLGSKQPGDEVVFFYSRGQRDKNEIKIKLGKNANPLSQLDRWGGGPFSEKRFGFPTVLPHDSVIDPNQCGGPVLNSQGEFVGINIARALRVSSYTVLAADVERIVGELKAKHNAAVREPVEQTKPSPGDTSDRSRARFPSHFELHLKQINTNFAVDEPLSALLTEIHADGIGGAILLNGRGPISEKAFDFFFDAGIKPDQAVSVSLLDFRSGTGPEKADSPELLELYRQGLRRSKKLDLRVRVIVVSQQDTKDDLVKAVKDCQRLWICGDNRQLMLDTLLDQAIHAELSGLLARDGLIAGNDLFSTLCGKFPLATEDSDAEMQTLGLLPQSIIDVVGEESSEAELADSMSQCPQAVGYRLAPNSTMIVAGRRIIMANGAADICFAKSATYPDCKINLNSDRRFEDLTAMRRFALARNGPTFPAENLADPNVENGTLIIIGGGGTPDGLMKQFVDLAGGENASIVVIPIAIPDPLPDQQGIVDELKQLGAKEVTVLTGRTPEQVMTAKSIAALKQATGIWFGGGRQWRFVDAYQGTAAEALMHQVLQRGGVIAGSSAGASIQGEYMARGNPLGSEDIMANGYEAGLGFLKGVAIDQHFSKRNRFADLASLVNRYPQLLGIGIDESTALVVQKNVAEVVGKHRVFFYDRRNPVEKDQPDFESVQAGGKYDLVERRVIDPGPEPEKEEQDSTKD